MSGGVGWGVGSFTLTIPPGAGPGQARTTIGPDLPPSLLAAFPNAFSGIVTFADGLNDDYYQFIVWSYAGPTPPNSPQQFLGACVAGDVRWTLLTSSPNSQLGGSVAGHGASIIRMIGTEMRWGNSLGTVGNPGVARVTDFSSLIVEGNNNVYTIDGIDQGRGVIGFAVAQADSAAIGAEAVILTAQNPSGGANITFRNGRAFAFDYGSRWAGSAANTVAVTAFRKTNLAGALILQASHEIFNTVGDQWRGARNIVLNTSGADIAIPIVFTVGATAGTVTQRGSALIPRQFTITDIGLASRFTGFPSL